ncbi:MAG TPA: hypothetical protein VEI57_14335 [Nitrospirota bacterium]|nr:hypothetical protein [Nitrospirota bacterium]
MASRKATLPRANGVQRAEVRKKVLDHATHHRRALAKIDADNVNFTIPTATTIEEREKLSEGPRDYGKRRWVA